MRQEFTVNETYQIAKGTIITQSHSGCVSLKALIKVTSAFRSTGKTPMSRVVNYG